MKRRALLKVFGLAPAVILTPGLLMPVKSIADPPRIYIMDNDIWIIGESTIEYMGKAPNPFILSDGYTIYGDPAMQKYRPKITFPKPLVSHNDTFQSSGAQNHGLVTNQSR